MQAPQRTREGRSVRFVTDFVTDFAPGAVTSSDKGRDAQLQGTGLVAAETAGNAAQKAGKPAQEAVLRGLNAVLCVSLQHTSKFMPFVTVVTAISPGQRFPAKPSARARFHPKKRSNTRKNRKET